MKFEIGKTYQHNNGQKMTIIGRLKTYTYGECLIGETDKGDLVPVGESEGHAVYWYECMCESKQKPKTEQKTEWISAEDRLPEEDKKVLVCYKCLCDKGYNCIYKTIGIGYCSFFGWFVKGVGQAVEVLAWMPLPEVYEEGEV